MTTKMFTAEGTKVLFAGKVIELGAKYLVNGREGVPFLAWVRDGEAPDGIVGQAHTDIRVNFGRGALSDFNSVARYNRSRKVADFVRV